MKNEDKLDLLLVYECHRQALVQFSARGLVTDTALGGRAEKVKRGRQNRYLAKPPAVPKREDERYPAREKFIAGPVLVNIDLFAYASQCQRTS